MNHSIQEITDFVIENINNKLSHIPQSEMQLRKAFNPDELKNIIDFQIPLNGIESEKLLVILEKVIEHSVQTNHPYFMNQMFGTMQPIAFLADLLIPILNTSMYTYEVAPVMTLIEKETIAKLASKIWGENNGDGVFTAGGSLSNMYALFLASQCKLKNVKKSGLCREKPLAIFISDQAHYSFTKGVNFMGYGIDSLIKIPSNSDARINISALQIAIQKAKEEGRMPLMLVAIAGTTISGTYDDITELSSIAKENNMWFHVDAAFGGSLLFSNQEKHKLKGIEKADSVTWNFHKVSGMPLSTSTFLTQQKGCLNIAFQADANYLFHDDDSDYDLGQKSLQGGRRPEALKLWLSLKYIGENGFANRIDTLRKITQTFSSFVQNNQNFELFQNPDSMIVCFRYFDKNSSEAALNELNIKLRETIFNEGKIIFNYAPLNGKIYLRCVFLDPEIKNTQLQNILNTILEKVDKLKD